MLGDLACHCRYIYINTYRGLLCINDVCAWAEYRILCEKPLLSEGSCFSFDRFVLLTFLTSWARDLFVPSHHAITKRRIHLVLVAYTGRLTSPYFDRCDQIVTS